MLGMRGGLAQRARSRSPHAIGPTFHFVGARRAGRGPVSSPPPPRPRNDPPVESDAMTTEERTDAATIENLLREERTFPPPSEFVARGLLKDPSIYERTATEDGFRAFWTDEGNRLDWI